MSEQRERKNKLRLSMVHVFVLLMALSVPQPTEHGWKTRHIEAVRYTNPVMGYNIGFRFTDCYRSDDPRIWTCIERHGGAVYQGGGFPCAEVFATFRGVTDRASADAKLRAILPAFEREVARFMR